MQICSPQDRGASTTTQCMLGFVRSEQGLKGRDSPHHSRHHCGRWIEVLPLRGRSTVAKDVGIEDQALIDRGHGVVLTRLQIPNRHTSLSEDVYDDRVSLPLDTMLVTRGKAVIVPERNIQAIRVL